MFKQIIKRHKQGISLYWFFEQFCHSIVFHTSSWFILIKVNYIFTFNSQWEYTPQKPQLTKPTLTLTIMKEDCNFDLSFVLCLNILVNFKPFGITGPVIHYFIHHYNHLHSQDSPNSTCNWHVTTKWMGSCNYFSVFLDWQRKI